MKAEPPSLWEPPAVAASDAAVSRIASSSALSPPEPPGALPIAQHVGRRQQEGTTTGRPRWRAPGWSPPAVAGAALLLV